MSKKEQGQEREPVTRESEFVKEHYDLWSWFGKMQGYLKVSRGFDEELVEEAFLKDLTVVRRKVQRARLLAFCHDFLTTCCEAPEDMLLKEFLQGFLFITDDELEDLNTILHVPKEVEREMFRSWAERGKEVGSGFWPHCCFNCSGISWIDMDNCFMICGKFWETLKQGEGKDKPWFNMKGTISGRFSSTGPNETAMGKVKRREG